MANHLSPAKCILLTIHYASEGNVKALHSFTPSRHDDLKAELVLRILLTHLPETVDPREYTTYVGEVASRLYLDVDREEVPVDTSPVAGIDEEQAKKLVKRVKLLDVTPPSFPPDAPDDLLTRFLCHRAYRIDSETGLLNLLPSLIEPFLSRNEYLRRWFVGIVLPLVRLQLEYYPDDHDVHVGLAEFEKLNGKESVALLMNHTTHAEQHVALDSARDARCLVGPWMYGHTDRKRRKLDHETAGAAGDRTSESLSSGVRKISLAGVSETDKTEHDWEILFEWLVFRSREDFPLVAELIEGWNGPSDVDLGSSAPQDKIVYLNEGTQIKLEAQYAQAAFAACYAVEVDTLETIQGAHGVLARLATLLDFVPPPDLATSVEALPKIERHAAVLTRSRTALHLEPAALLKPDHPLTTPRLETYMLLQMMVYSAYQLVGLGYAASLVNVAKLHFYATEDEQMAALQKILRTLGRAGSTKDGIPWTAERAKLVWLWSWGIDSDDGDNSIGAGVLGKIPRHDFEAEMLRTYVDAGRYDLALSLYLDSSSSILPRERVQEVVLTKAMEAYDAATNGNRTRGGMKKASDIVAAFRPSFPQSLGFRQAASLLSATHALSFYQLTLQHGVPFQPVNIRVSQDPVGLIDKVLAQDSGSYTKLDDLVGIGQDLVSAGLPDTCEDSNEISARRKAAERRVTFMAIEAALHEDDFETSYSYIVNRLTPSSAAIEAAQHTSDAGKGHARNVSRSSTRSYAADAEDDSSWRAAFLAGRYRPSNSTSPSLRRLEQRTELLSLALLLAPVSALTEILAAWRRCEEETTALHASQQQAEEEFDDRADKRQSASLLPGNFSTLDEQPALLYNQKRRELGRMAGSSASDEAPVSMFDLTRNAAQALSRNAFPLHGGGGAREDRHADDPGDGMDDFGDDGTDGQQRMRKRDMVANAVSGGLASGLGWVLGATPAHQVQSQRE